MYITIHVFFNWINLLAQYQPTLLLIYLPLFYAFLCIFSIAFKTLLSHDNKSFWMESSVTHSKEYRFDAYRGIKVLFLICSKAKETHRSWFTGRGLQVVVAELIPITWHKTSHLIGSNQIFNHDNDRIKENDRGCVGVVCEAPEGPGRMMQSKPEWSVGFDVSIRLEPKGASWTSPKQPGPYYHYDNKLAISQYFHWKLCCTTLTEPGVAAILFLEIYWAYLYNCSRKDGIKLWT